MSVHISLPDSFINWQWYRDVNTKFLFLHLLLTAEFRGESVYMGISIKRGQLVTWRGQLASSLGLSERKIRRSLKKLESTGHITLYPFEKQTVITITNYDKYCSSE